MAISRERMMVERFLGFGFVFYLVCGSVSASAEIYQCDGKWTNRPCDGQIERTMHEKASEDDIAFEDQVAAAKADANPVEAPKDEKEVVLEPLAPRYSIARKLRKLSRDLTEKYKIVGLSKEELHDFEERCVNRQIPISQCQSEYDSQAQRLNAKVEEKTKKK